MYPASLYPPSIDPAALFPGAGKGGGTPPAPGLVGLYPAALFPAAPFPPSLYPGPGGTPPPDLPATLAAAIAATLRGSAPLAALATGGFFNGQASDGAAMGTAPYVTFADVADTGFGNSRDGIAYVYRLIRFNCHASTEGVAFRMGTLVHGAGLGSMAFGEGYLMSWLYQGGSTLEMPRRARDNARSWCRTMVFRAKVGGLS